MLEDELKKLGRIRPDEHFVNRARGRLMSKIHQDNEVWFMAFLRRVGVVHPSLSFVPMARQRLLALTVSAPQRMIYLLSWFKKCLASTLVMTVLALSTLFFVDGEQYVTAYQDTRLMIRVGDVLLQHANEVSWQRVTQDVIIKAGDTIQLNPEAYAMVTFFDDSQLRLSDRATVVFNGIDSGARQGKGMISLSLLAGRAWLQSLNVAADHQSVVIRTPDALLGMDQGSLDITVDPATATTVRVFKNNTLVDVLDEHSGLSLEQRKLTSDREMAVDLGEPMKTSAIVPEVYTQPWVMDNTAQDQIHLIALQEREFELRRQSAGILPGHFLYPLKEAKERLSQFLAFTPESEHGLQLEIANKRLNEAIILFRQKKYAKAQEALMAYQSIARDIARAAQKNHSLKTQVQTELIARNNKSLVAAMPTSQINLVQAALNETEEMITENPLERERVRLQNMVNHLNQVSDLVAAGHVESAQDILVAYETMESRILTEANTIESIEERQLVLNEILEIRNDALTAVHSLAEKVAQTPDLDRHLVAIVTSVDQAAQREVNKVNALMQPLRPAASSVVAPDPVQTKVAEFVDRVSVYRTWQAQKNQVNVLLNRMGKDAKNIELLARIRTAIESPRVRDLINVRILELKSKARYNKNKAVERKIDQAKSLRGEIVD